MADISLIYIMGLSEKDFDKATAEQESLIRLVARTKDNLDKLLKEEVDNES